MAATPAARAARWPIGFAAVVLTYWAFDYSLASNMRRANPEAAYRARPNDPGAIAAAMNDRMVVRNQFEADADDAANARSGLRTDPLNRVLLRTLGVHAEINRKPQDAYAAMQMADRVSRRDSITELWLAEYHRRKNAPARALVHYDAAMLVRPDLQKALFPQMTKALADADFRAAVRPYIVREASWVVPFVGTAASADLDQVLALIEPVADKLADKEFEPASARIIYRLMARGDTRQALALARQVFPKFSAREFQAPGWNSTTTDPRFGTLAWSFEQTGDLSAVLEDDAKLSVTVNPLASGRFAARDILVRPGTAYRLSHVIDYGQSAAQARVQWTAACVSEQSASVFWQGDVPLIRVRTQYSAALTTPASCNLLRLTANAIGPDAQVPSEFSISSLTLSGSTIDG